MFQQSVLLLFYVFLFHLVQNNVFGRSYPRFEYNGEYVKDDTRRIIFIKGEKIILEEDYDVDDQIFEFIDSSLTCFFVNLTDQNLLQEKLNRLM